MDPLVTVVVCACNDAQFVERAVRGALGQQGLPTGAIELIATDDGSTDGTKELLAGFGDAITLVTQDQLGPTVATNRAVGRARGRFLALLDADDEWFPDKLARQLDLLERRPEVGLVHGDLEVVDGAGAVLSASKYERFDQGPVVGHALGALLNGNEATTSAILVRTELARAIPPTPDWAWCRDWWIATQIAACHEIDAVLEPVGRYRIHGANFSAVDGDAARTLTLWHRDLRVRRILIRTLDLETVPLDELAAAWRRVTEFAQRVAAGRRVPIVEVLSVDEADRAEADERLNEARAALDDDPLAAGRRALQALVANPYEGDGPQVYEEARRRLQAPTARPPTVPPRSIAHEDRLRTLAELRREAEESAADAPLAEVRAHVRRARRALASVQRGLPPGVALPDAETRAHAALEAQLAALSAPPAARDAAAERVPADDHVPVLEAPRAFVGLVIADEAIADPDLLRGWAACFDGGDDATLVLYAPDAEPASIHPPLVAALAAAGIAADDERDMTLVAAPRTDLLEAALAREAHVLLSRAPGPRALAALPRADAYDAPRLRTFARGRQAARA